MRFRYAALASALISAVLLALTACGGSDDEDTLPAVADVAPELANLGDLATLHSQPVSETFGPDGGELTLADGATVEVPEGAFAEPVELTVAIVDVEVEDPVKDLRVYHLSTVEDIGPLAEPVVLKAPQLADQVVVAQLQDGEWRPVAVSTGTTTTANIGHFSSNLTSFWNCGTIVLGLAEIDKKASPDIAALAGLVCGAITFADEDDDDDGPFGDEPAFDPAPTLNPEDLAFINSVLDDIANEFERDKASNETIAATKATVRSCLTEALLAGDTHSSAIGKCDPDPGSSPAPDPDPDPGTGPDCPVTGSATACDPGHEPEPGQTSAPTATPTPTPTPAPTPTPEPTAEPEPTASITIVGHTAERSAEVCKQTFELCTYVVTVSVEFTTSVPSALYCFQVIDGGAASWGNDTGVPSGPGALTVTNSLHSSPPDGPYSIPVTCDLRDISDGLNFAPVIATDSVPLNVSVPPLPD